MAIEREGFNFLPLVRKSLELTCELKIVFLRRGEPGSLVLPGGDIDNRMKTFFDGLKIPAALTGRLSDAEAASGDSNPFLCLVEEDALITGFSIETDRLLTPAQKHPDNVRLVVEATIRVMRINQHNVGFLGD